jgi:uncharacterized RDD family membrane protein YckC
MKIVVKRAFAVVIDLTVIGILGIYVIPWIMMAVLFLNTTDQSSPGHAQLHFPGASTVLALTVSFLFWPFIWSAIFGGFFKSSLGKIIMGLKVYTNAAYKMSMWRGGMRESFRIMEVVCTVGAILSFINVVRGYKSITDMIFETTVLDKRVFVNS